MISIKENSNKININFSSLFVFYIGSNLSLYFAGCFINKFNITKYIVIFTGQGGINKSKDYDLKFICKTTNIDISNCILIDQEFNYKYFKMYLNKNELLRKLKKIIYTNNFNYVTSFDYGLVNSLIKNNFNKNNNYLILEDGIDNWINIKNKNHILKSLLYTLTLVQKTYINKFRHLRNKIIITSLNRKEFYNFKTKIDISDKVLDLVKTMEKKFFLKKNTSKKILIICARTSRYHNGINNFLENTKKNILKNFKQFNNQNINFYYKLHPGYTRINNLIDDKFILIKYDNIPIELFNLKEFDLIISPVNTSIVYIKELNKIDLSKLFYYDIDQSDFSTKLELINRLQIKKFDNNFYKY